VSIYLFDCLRNIKEGICKKTTASQKHKRYQNISSTKRFKNMLMFCYYMIYTIVLFGDINNRAIPTLLGQTILEPHR